MVMGTRIYGSSDDNIYADGDYRGQFSKFGTEDADKGVLVLLSDGSILEIKYGKLGMSIWGIKVFKKGDLFSRLDICTNEDDETYSDIAHFNEGITWIYVCSEWCKLE